MTDSSIPAILSANLPLVVVAVVLLCVLAWWLWLATRRTRVAVDRRDTLDDGAARAARNQALLDAAPVAPAPPAMPGGLGAAGAAVEATVADAQARRDADAAPAISDGDDLTRIKGLGPKIATILRDMGITRFDQIAGWSDADVARIDPQLGRFQGRIMRDDWIGQAALLATGDEAAFRDRYGANPGTSQTQHR